MFDFCPGFLTLTFFPQPIQIWQTCTKQLWLHNKLRFCCKRNKKWAINKSELSLESVRDKKEKFLNILRNSKAVFEKSKNLLEKLFEPDKARSELLSVKLNI